MPGMGYFFLEFLASEVLWILKYNYLPKLLLTFQNETLLLKIPHTWVMERGDIKLAMTWRLYPSWIIFIVLEGALLTTRWKKLIISLPSCEPMSHNDDLSGKTRPLVQRGTGVIGVTNYFLIGFQVHFKNWSLSLAQCQGQELGDRQVIQPRGEPVTTALAKGHIIQLLDVPLYPQIGACLNPHQRNLVL